MPRWKRSRYWGYDDDLSKVELRHGRGKSISDSAVQQESRFKWLVKAQTNKGQQYTVRQEMDEFTSDHEIDCDFCNEYEDAEDCCKECGICCLFYSCDCPDDHEICKHIHKVHMMNQKLISEQGPHTLEKTIENRASKLRNLLDTKVHQLTGPAQENLAAKLEEVLNCFQVKPEQITIIDEPVPEAVDSKENVTVKVEKY